MTDAWLNESPLSMLDTPFRSWGMKSLFVSKPLVPFRSAAFSLRCIDVYVASMLIPCFRSLRIRSTTSHSHTPPYSLADRALQFQFHLSQVPSPKSEVSSLNPNPNLNSIISTQTENRTLTVTSTWAQSVRSTFDILHSTFCILN